MHTHESSLVHVVLVYKYHDMKADRRHRVPYFETYFGHVFNILISTYINTKMFVRVCFRVFLGYFETN